MQNYLLIIKNLLADWYLLTVANPLYAATIAIAVWLLTALLYSIRIGSLKKKIAGDERALSEAQNHLDNARTQVLQLKEELAGSVEQLEQIRTATENQTQRADKLQQQLLQRNTQIAGLIQTLSTGFDIGERPLPVTQDIQAENLWQQHERVLTQLTARLRAEQQAKAEWQQSYQAESIKRSEQEALIKSLQTTADIQARQIQGLQASLDSQTGQFAELQQTIDEQKALLQEQQDKAQHAVSEVMAKHQADLERLNELEQQVLELEDAKHQLRQLQAALTAKDALIAQLEKQPSRKPVDVQPVAAQTQTKATEQPVPEPAATEEETPTEYYPPNDQLMQLTASFKTFFGKSAQQTIEEPAPEATEQPEASPARESFGLIKNLFGKSKEAVIEEQPEAIQPEIIEQSPDSTFGFMKNLFGKAREEERQEETQPEIIEQLPESPFGFIKNLLGKAEQAPKVEEPEMPPEEPAENVSSQLKGFFRKFTSKTE